MAAPGAEQRRFPLPRLRLSKLLGAPPPPKVTLGVGLEPAPQRGGRSAGSGPSTSGSAACPRLAMLLARALRAAAALRPALPPRRPLSSLPPRALLPPPPLARSLWQRSDGGGWRGALLRPRRGSAGGVSCGCGGLHTEGERGGERGAAPCAGRGAADPHGTWGGVGGGGHRAQRFGSVPPQGTKRSRSS